ncbi:MAG: hypothetical protein A2138_14235 [Deltaproteobacteria bacterium RBG_16_71_12]|nr:MAG: hypothetical protein A2138_14235 [Deltaproteobacteria bacterium RBG_16_71_12]
MAPILGFVAMKRAASLPILALATACQTARPLLDLPRGADEFRTAPVPDGVTVVRITGHGMPNMSSFFYQLQREGARGTLEASVHEPGACVLLLPRVHAQDTCAVTATDWAEFDEAVTRAVSAPFDDRGASDGVAFTIRVRRGETYEERFAWNPVEDGPVDRLERAQSVLASRCLNLPDDRTTGLAGLEIEARP